MKLKIIRASGLVVKSNVAIVGRRVRLSAGAEFLLHHTFCSLHFNASTFCTTMNALTKNGIQRHILHFSTTTSCLFDHFQPFFVLHSNIILVQTSSFLQHVTCIALLAAHKSVHTTLKIQINIGYTSMQRNKYSNGNNNTILIHICLISNLVKYCCLK